MKESVKFFGGFVLGAGVGLLVGYKTMEKRLADQYEVRLQQETSDMKEFYSHTKEQIFKTPEEAVAALIPDKEMPEDPRVKSQKIQYNKIVKDNHYLDEPSVEDLAADGSAETCEIDETVHQNVFQESRNPDKPYIISQDEFMANETGYEQATLTYHAKGGVLTDDRDDQFENGAVVLGDDFASNFGKDSSDENTVHVRNESLQMEFEVVSVDLSYEQAVLGFDADEAPHKRVRH